MQAIQDLIDRPGQKLTLLLGQNHLTLSHPRVQRQLGGMGQVPALVLVDQQPGGVRRRHLIVGVHGPQADPLLQPGDMSGRAPDLAQKRLDRIGVQLGAGERTGLVHVSDRSLVTGLGVAAVVDATTKTGVAGPIAGRHPAQIAGSVGLHPVAALVRRYGGLTLQVGDTGGAGLGARLPLHSRYSPEEPKPDDPRSDGSSRSTRVWTMSAAAKGIGINWASRIPALAVNVSNPMFCTPTNKGYRTWGSIRSPPRPECD